MSYKQKIEETLSRSVCGGWDRGFLESILSQMSKDKKLSVKQKQTLGKVLARNTAEAQKFHEGWRETYNKDYKADARVLATYHKQQPYYRNMAEDILSDRVPERSRFLRMYENKYSKKVLSQYHIAPRYATGEYDESATVLGVDVSVMYAKYTYGSFTVGYQQNEDDGPTTATTDESDSWAVSYAVSDDLSVSYGQHTYNDGNLTPDQESSGFSASYTMGGTTISAAFNETENVRGIAANDEDSYEIALSFAF